MSLSAAPPDGHVPLEPRRIAIQTDGALVQGNERQIALIATGLIGRGHEVHISARPGSAAWQHFADTGAHLSDARVRGIADLWNAGRFAMWLRTLRPHAVLFTSWRRLWIAAAAARAARVPRTVMRFGACHPIPPGIGGVHYRHALVHLVDHVYATSRTAYDHLRASLPELGDERLSIILNGIPDVSAAPAPLRERLKLPPHSVVVAAVGGLAPVKGFDLLIPVFARASTSEHLVICGQGSERSPLEALARECGVADRVHFLGQCDDVPGVLAASDLFVLSSRAEGFSIALLEAMHAGLPVISTDVGVAREAICDGSGAAAAGWIVPVNDAERMRTTLAQVLRSLRTQEVQARGEAARAVARRFTVERMIEQVERVLLA